MLTIIISIIVLFIGLPILIGLSNSDESEFGFEIVNPGFNSFEIGITNRAYQWDNGDSEQELRIGLLLLTISFSFFRNAA